MSTEKLDQATPNRGWVPYALMISLGVVVPAWFGGIAWGALQIFRAMAGS